MKISLGKEPIEIVTPNEIVRRDITIPVKRHVTAINGLLSTPWTALQCMSGRTINAPWGPGEDGEIVNAVLALYQKAGWSVSCTTVPSGPNECEVRMTFRLPTPRETVEVGALMTAGVGFAEAGTVVPK